MTDCKFKLCLGVFDCPFSSALQKRSTLEVCRVSCQTLRVLPFNACALPRHQCHSQRICNASCDVTLDSEDVIELPVIPTGPSCLLRLHVDQLGCYSYLVPSLSDASLYNVRNLQLAPDLLRRFRASLVAVYRSFSNHSEALYFRKRSDQFFSHAVCKVAFTRIGADVDEWDYCDTFLKEVGSEEVPEPSGASTSS